ncbi:MAG: single-stranded DNA-binding protein [Pirellulales bacterium]
MASLNKVFLIGNLTRDPQLRYTPSGTPVADFGLAVNRNWTGRDGQRHEETVFVDVTLWARQAEVASEYLSKGRPVLIEGRLQYEQWESAEGQKRNKLSVVGERMQMLGGRRSGGEQEGEFSARRAAAPAGNDTGSGDDAGAPPDDDIPF